MGVTWSDFLLMVLWGRGSVGCYSHFYHGGWDKWRGGLIFYRFFPDQGHRGDAVVLEATAREDGVAAEAGARWIVRLEIHADPLCGAVRQVDGAVQPPGAVVVPEMVVGSRSLLTAGNDGRCDLIHGDVVVWIHDIAMPGKQNARPDDISTGVGKFR